MKLLFIFFNPSGGMGTLNRIRSRALMQAGHEVHLLYTSGDEENRHVEGIPAFFLRDLEAVKDLARRETYDFIIACTDIWAMEGIRQIGYGGRIVYEVQGLGPPDTARATIQAFSASIRKCADALLYPVTSHLQELMQAEFPDIPQFSFDDPLDTEHFGYIDYPPKPYPIIGWVGRIEANKNWREFLAIGERLLFYYPELYMWMFGNDVLFEEAEQTAFNSWMACSPHAHRLIRYSNIPQEQMADYMSMIGDSGGFLCSTSILEGFGYAVAEAMLCRCPVLSTDSDGVRRFLTHNVTGKLYGRGHVEEAVMQALDLMGNKPLREALRTRGRRHIQSQFSTRAYVAQFQAMLKALTRINPKG